MTHAQPITCPFDRFAYILEMLCKVVAASHNRGLGVPAPLVVLIWKMLRRKAVRFAKLAAAFQAGTLPAPTDKRRRSSIRAAPAIPASQTQPPHLPTRFAWLINLIAGTRQFRSLLLRLLSDPQLAEFVTAAPQVGGMLRGLCRTLGIKNPENYCEALRREKSPSRRKPRSRPRVDYQPPFSANPVKLPDSFPDLTWRLPSVPGRGHAPPAPPSQPRPPSRGRPQVQRSIDLHPPRERRPDDPAPPTFLTVHRFSRS